MSSTKCDVGTQGILCRHASKSTKCYVGTQVRNVIYIMLCRHACTNVMVNTQVRMLCMRHASTILCRHASTNVMSARKSMDVGTQVRMLCRHASTNVM